MTDKKIQEFINLIKKLIDEIESMEEFNMIHEILTEINDLIRTKILSLD